MAAGGGDGATTTRGGNGATTTRTTRWGSTVTGKLSDDFLRLDDGGGEFDVMGLP